jgi:calcium/calmodulin-dependent protein kinase I
MAPEILRQERYGSKCDIWSLGVLTYKLVFGTYPFVAPNCRELYDVIKLGAFSFPATQFVTPESIDFIKKCLTLHPNDRPSAEYLLGHPWMSKLTQGKQEEQQQ